MNLETTGGSPGPHRHASPSFELGDGSTMAPPNWSDMGTDDPDEDERGGLEYPPDAPSSDEHSGLGPHHGATDEGSDPGHVDDLVHMLMERERLVAEIISEIDHALGGLHGSDVHTLHQMLRAPGMTPSALRALHSNGLLVTHAKGLAYDRLNSDGAGQSPAPVTPGWSSRDGLSVDEVRRIKELAPRLNVPVEELKAQYTARKRQSA